MDGMRLNQPFGDVVSWDLIPRLAIATTTMMPGSNPLFGLNTLGGALSIHTKDGTSAPGTSVQAVYGSEVRRSIEFEHGGQKANGLNWYVTGNLFKEDGWRDDSPSDVRQVFGKIGWSDRCTRLFVSLAHANNSLNGNGLQEIGFLDRDYSSVYTKPDITDNRSTLLNVTGRRNLDTQLSVSGNFYYRDINTDTFNGDINEDSLDQVGLSAERGRTGSAHAAGYTRLSDQRRKCGQHAFPVWRCIGNVLLRDEPGEKCNGLINRRNRSSTTWGVSGR